jgi:hypothetical protein
MNNEYANASPLIYPGHEQGCAAQYIAIHLSLFFFHSFGFVSGLGFVFGIRIGFGLRFGFRFTCRLGFGRLFTDHVSHACAG